MSKESGSVPDDQPDKINEPAISDWLRENKVGQLAIEQLGLDSAVEAKAAKTWEGSTEALARIKAGDAKSVAYGLSKYKGLTNEVAMELIDAGQGGAVSWYPDKFDGLDHDATILHLISVKEAELKQYKQKLLDAGISPYDSRVRQALHGNKYRGITQNLYKFQLKPETLDELESQGFVKTVASYRAGKRPGRGLTNQQRLSRTAAELRFRS